MVLIGFWLVPMILRYVWWSLQIVIFIDDYTDCDFFINDSNDF